MAVGAFAVMVWHDWITTLAVAVIILALALRRTAEEYTWAPRNITELTRGVYARRHVSIESAWKLVDAAREDNPGATPTELWQHISKVM